MPDGAVAYRLALIYKQASELCKRDKLLVKSDDLHFRSHVALPVLPSTGMTLHDAQVFHSARHQGIEVLTYIFQELKRRIEQQGGYLVIQSSLCLCVGETMQEVVFGMASSLGYVLAVGNVWHPQIILAYDFCHGYISVCKRQELNASCTIPIIFHVERMLRLQSYMGEWVAPLFSP